jgi:hypothetical protein
MLSASRLMQPGESVDRAATCHYAAMAWWAYPLSGFTDADVKTAIGFANVQRITFGDLAGLEGVIASWQNSCTVAICGTTQIGQWLDYVIRNGMANATGLAGQVYQRFDVWSNQIVDTVKGQVDRNTFLSLCGHSLGGALAILVGEKLKRQGWNVQVAHTFGCPRVGDEDFVNAVGLRCHNYIASNDVVPMLPPALLTNGRLLDQVGVVVPFAFRPPFDWLDPRWRVQDLFNYQFWNAWIQFRAAFQLIGRQLTAHSINTYLPGRWRSPLLTGADRFALQAWVDLAVAKWGFSASDFS